MTPEERELIADLFERLAPLESEPRDPDAERAIREGLARAPNALYALVQTVLVQEEALAESEDYIQKLEAELGIKPQEQQQEPPKGFLDSMRDSLFGGRQEQQTPPASPRAGSVPSVGGPDQPMGTPPKWRAAGYEQAPMAQAPMQQPEPSGRGSFLGTAAAAAAGAIGGSLLLDGIRNMTGKTGHGALDGAQAQRGSPWDSSPSGPGGPSGDLARQAGLDDIGRASAPSGQDPASRYGAFSTAQNESEEDDEEYEYEDDDSADADDSDTA